jgi:hypothetical protein
MKMRLLLVGSVLAVTGGVFPAPAHACMGEVCDAINFVCAKVMKGGQACVQ